MELKILWLKTVEKVELSAVLIWKKKSIFTLIYIVFKYIF